MSIFRSDQQVALNDLLVASEKTADHYRDSADFLDDHPVAENLREIADQRDALAERIKTAIQASGDLPSAPDEDRESVEKLFHRFHASLAHDEIRDILQQRLDAEGEFKRLISNIRSTGWGAGIESLLDEVENHVDADAEKVRSCLQAYPD